ncbi:MAG TPA: bifunctional UDP-N-acetylmuramoyl-tripeptide:D-alanyl-D-alanine ligase/alanine racemase [Flavobacteriales bacterium]|nr:bifunctional UDP-N-acetylmuramoyl-tripeptide:D-alanyl-D-alanine ligase/alanine racemase [Flavobacteriales bacterium]
MKISSCFINDVANQTGGKIVQYFNNAAVQFLVYDTRSLFASSGSMFIALKSAKRNGHEFIGEAYKKGIRNFLVDEDVPVPGEEVNIIKVNDVLQSLQQWAHKHRLKMNYPVVAVTGSNGKTTLKEWMNTLLSPFYSISRSPRSFNSQLGVPLSLLQLEPYHKLALIEAGISKPGEMEALGKIIKPDITILTNVEQAHASNFKDKAQHVAEKLKLAETSTLLVYCADDEEIHKQASGLKCNKVNWGFTNGMLRFKNENDQLVLVTDSKNIIFDLHVYDKGSIQNLCHAIAASYALGVEPHKIKTGINDITPIEMRFELKEGVNNCQVLNDTYSLDFYSFQLAVEYVCRNAGNLTKTIIVSDFPEITSGKERFYKEAGKFLNESGINKVIGIGHDVKLLKLTYQGNFHVFESTDEFMAKLPVTNFKDELILIKGSRTSQFEKIVSFFDLKLHSTYLKVDLAAIQHNLNYYQSLVKPGTKTMVMVKALAYGSGSREISNLLEFNKVDYLAVAYADEGVELRKSGIKLPVMVMNADESTFGLLLQHDLQPEIYNFHQLEQFAHFLQIRGKGHYPIHVKLDTGMHRLGFRRHEIDALMKQLKQYAGLFKIESVFSHLATADEDAQNDFTLQQINEFDLLSKQITSTVNYPVIRHILNSPGIERFHAHAFDMVRLGIGLHGIAATKNAQQHLTPVHTLVSRISHINELNEGDTVGYGRKGKITGKRRIAVIPIGYADGYSRSFGNGKGKMLINGQLAPVIGNVCMDMTMVDVTDIPHTQLDDEVIVFGHGLPVTQLAEWIGTIPYEILTSVSTRVKRVYVDNV